MSFFTIADNQVLQRGLPVTLSNPEADAEGPVLFTLESGGKPVAGFDSVEVGHADADGWKATISGLPVGGPFDLRLEAGDFQLVSARNVYVGDLWVLGGQSNMEGCGLLSDLERGVEAIHSFDMADHWVRAEEPLHWLCDSVDPAHYEPHGGGDAEAIIEIHRTRTQGAGLGLAFAKALHHETHVPIGLIPCAHGGTSLDQWSPKRRGEGGRSLYGAMVRRVKAVGGGVAGMLWYQGESDACDPTGAESASYGERFEEFVAAVRADFSDPGLPIHTVQLGRFIKPESWGELGGSAEWNAVQEHQRTLSERISNLFMVSAVDLELDDAIHIGTYGLKRLGRRLARSVSLSVKGTPGLADVRFVDERRMHIRVIFQGLEPPGLEPSLRVIGFSLSDEKGDEVPFLYKAEVRPDARYEVRLHAVEPVPEGWSLWYGRGFDPAALLVDAADMAVPTFGPIGL